MNRAVLLTEHPHSLAFAAGLDAGNRSMRRAGRQTWNLKDAEAASEETSRLLFSLAPAWERTAINTDRMAHGLHPFSLGSGLALSVRPG